MRHSSSIMLLGLICTIGPAILRANETLEGKACRSVHLAYPAGRGAAFYNEVTVDRSAPGTYFCACGWDKGYFGMQELDGGKKVLIFSVWDSEQNDPRAVGEERRVKLLHKDEKVRIGRFGGEGTGGQSFLDYDWKAGETYRFLVSADVKGERTEYAGYFYVPEEKAWRHLVTFSTITGGRPLGGYYSFVEDFKRDGVSATRVREARFGNAWLKSVDGRWTAVVKARFTADRNPAINIDAGVRDGRFFLVTGGATENRGAKLNGAIDQPPMDRRISPQDLPVLSFHSLGLDDLLASLGHPPRCISRVDDQPRMRHDEGPVIG
jgi:hypothetical protein